MEVIMENQKNYTFKVKTVSAVGYWWISSIFMVFAIVPIVTAILLESCIVEAHGDMAFAALVIIAKTTIYLVHNMR